MTSSTSRTSRPQRNPRSRRNGVTTVEVALCLPVLFLFFFASSEFSRVNMLRQAANQAAYEGARVGIAPGATVGGVRTAAADILSSAWAQGYTINVTPGTINQDTPQVTVDVAIPLAQNSLAVMVFFNNGTALTGRCTLQREKYESFGGP